MLNSIGKNLDSGKQTDVVFMDLSKAYLSDRFQQETVHGATSRSLPIISGVPQGSLLGPFLFLCMSMTWVLHISASTAVGLFADDTKCYRTIRSPSNVLALQEDIYGLHSWFNDVNLPFNLPKCKVLSVTRKSSPIITRYNFDGRHLIHSDVETWKPPGHLRLPPSYCRRIG